MSCERFRAALVDHACGASIDDETASHVQSCAACRQQYAELRKQLADADAELRGALSLSASPEFASRVTASVRARASQPAWQVWWLGAAAAAALACAAYLAPAASPQRMLPPSDSPHGVRPGASANAAQAQESIHLPVERRAAASTAQPAPTDREPLVGTWRPRDRTPTGRRAATRGDHGPPLVLVDGTQAHALARLRDLVRRGALNADTVRERSEAPAEILIAPLSIPELAVTNIQDVTAPPPAGGEEGH